MWPTGAQFSRRAIPEMVRDTETGRLADVGNATDLAQKILWILEHSREREMMSKAACAYVLGSFTTQRQAAACELLYQNHLSAQTGGRQIAYASSRVGAGGKACRDFWT
jgi:hypothetical protein